MEEANFVQSNSTAAEQLSAAEGNPTMASASLTDTIAQSYSAFRQGEMADAVSSLLFKIIVPAAGALLTLIVVYFTAQLIARWTTSILCDRVDRTLGKFGGRLVFHTLMSVATLAILQTLGIGVTGFAAVLAAAGFAIGLAFQGTLSNFAAGVLLLVFRPFKVGDVVNTAGVFGKVNAIDLFTTTFDTPDNRRLIVPNSSITGATIENVTFHSERRVEVLVGVEYAASLDKTREVLTACAKSLAELTIAGEDRGFTVILANLGTSSVDWKVRVWTANENFFRVQEKLTEEIKRQLDRHGIGIPFPQMQLHLPPTESPLATETTTAGQRLSVPKIHDSPADTVSKRIRPRSRTRTATQSSS